MRRRVEPGRETEEPDRRGPSWGPMDAMRAQRGLRSGGQALPRPPAARGDLVTADNYVRAGEAACSYSRNTPPRRSRQRIARSSRRKVRTYRSIIEFIRGYMDAGAYNGDPIIGSEPGHTSRLLAPPV